MKSNKLQLLPQSAIVRSTDGRAPKADISNAGHLMGDVYEEGDVDSLYGDASEDGDPDEGTYGDAAYGDVSTAALNTWDSLIGDAEEQGALRIKPFNRWSRGAKIGTIAGVAGLSAYGISRLIKKRKAARARVQASLQRSNRANTIANQVRARRMMGRIPRTSQFPFYQVIGATLNSYPLSPTEAFPADILKFNFDRQSTDTPFEVEIVNGTFAGVTWTTQAVGVAAARYYTGIFLTVGISILNANPGTIFSVTGTLPTINGGTLVISTNPFSFTLRASVYYAKFLLFPWQLITNKPILALGSYNNANPITLNTVGLPSTASVSMIVPGSQHPWTIAMRNRLL